MKQSLFADVNQLNQTFAQRIARLLSEGIEKNGRASLVVSGGRTPVPLFHILSEQAINWGQVDISLADERWVETTDDASNEKMVRAHLLQNKAAEANFVGLKNDSTDAEQAVENCNANFSQLRTPVDVLILGMGEDGHTASLFPCSTELSMGLNTDNESNFIAVQPTTAPNQRMSMTLKALLNSQATFLHLTGQGKKAVLEEALAGIDVMAMPIRAILQQSDVELVWAP